MIYFLSDDKLAADLRTGALPEAEKFFYYVLLTLWSCISGSSFYADWQYEAGTHLNRVADIYILIVTMVGTWTAYDINKEGDHRDFITRIICLTVPCLLRMLLLGCLFVFPALLVNDNFHFGIEQKTLLFVMNIIIYPYFYYRLCRAMRICASAAKTP